MTRSSLRRLLLAGMATAVVAGCVENDDTSFEEAQPQSTAALQPSRVVESRLVCSFANDDAKTAMVEGADGGQSVQIRDRTYWLFGDTLFYPQSGKQIEPNTMAFSTIRDANGCPELHYVSRNGVAERVIQKDGSLTVWPSGAVLRSETELDVFAVYVYGVGPVDYWIGEVGLVRIDLSTMQPTVIARSLWDAGSGFGSPVIAVQPVDEDDSGRLRFVLQTASGRKLLTRAPRNRIQHATAYEYWNGHTWQRDARSAVDLWETADPTDPVQRLVEFEGGTHIQWIDDVGAYVAIMNVGFDAIGARVARAVEGPWSEPVRWLDCSAFAQPRVPICYAPFLHPQFSNDGRLWVTLTRFGQYDVVAFELTVQLPEMEP